jgi:hypothetical protein
MLKKYFSSVFSVDIIILDSRWLFLRFLLGIKGKIIFGLDFIYYN